MLGTILIVVLILVLIGGEWAKLGGHAAIA